MLHQFCMALVLIFSPLLSTITQQVQATGQQVDDFELNDFRGNAVALSDYKEAKVVVLVVLGTECPLAKLYGSRLQELNTRFGSEVVFIGLNANTQDSVTEIAAYARRHKIAFPILKDLGNKIVDVLGAVRTPEVFVLDSQWRIRYQGRIDDQYAPGVIRDSAKREFLADAVIALLAGRNPRKSYVEPVGCRIGRVQTPIANSKVTYSNQISRILQKRCVNCHRDGEIAPFTLIDYDEVVGWAEMIAEVIEEQRMPPWHATQDHLEFMNDRTMSDEEKELIYSWVANGAPEGDPRMLPPPLSFPVTDWDLPEKPDAVFKIQETPFKVKAQGEVKYQWFTVTPGFSEDKWIRAVEIIPGNRAVVHHILAFIQLSGQTQLRGAKGYLAGYVPGLRADGFPAGMAKRMPVGAKLVFQIHYTPVGIEQLDQSKIGFVFMKDVDVKQEIVTTSAVNARFLIPAGESHHKVTALSEKMSGTVTLIGMSPHMHLRGKSFRYDVRLPNGETETLLDIPAYDFNWQTLYRLATPKRLPAGAQILCIAHFDNSEANLNNPDPTVDVRWGDQTWEEMMIGYFDIAVPKGTVTAGNARPSAEARLRQTFTQLDRNKNGVVELKDVPGKYAARIKAMDSNGDDKLTVYELNDYIKRVQLRKQ
jgi:peroxiredoxin